MSLATPAEDSRRILERHRAIWAQKPVLRAIYERWYERIIAQLPTPANKVIEIGGGSGNLKGQLPGAVSSDITHCPWLDLVCDGQRLPFADQSIDGLVMVDVLHHLADPLAFVAEAQRALRPGGRLIVFDVYISPFSHLVMKLAHPEPVDMGADLFAGPLEEGQRHPWCANQAVATLLFWRYLHKFSALHADLRVIQREVSDIIAYPLSGGFEFYSLIPRRALPLFYAFERLCQPLAKLLAFRSLIVLEKGPTDSILQSLA